MAKETKLEKLERENAVLKEQLRIAELEKENADLRRRITEMQLYWRHRPYTNLETFSNEFWTSNSVLC